MKKRKFGDDPPPERGGAEEKAAHKTALGCIHHMHAHGIECGDEHIENVKKFTREMHPDSNHSDEALARKLRGHLKGLKREKLVADQSEKSLKAIYE